MIITVSDTTGIKQYNIPDNIKKIVLFFLTIIILMIGGLSYYGKALYDKVSVLETNIEKEKVLEKKRVATLAKNKSLLEEKVKQEKLEKIEKDRQLKIAKANEDEIKAVQLKKEKLKEASLAKIKKEKKLKAKKEAELKAKKATLKQEKLKKEKLAKIKEEKKRKKAKDRAKKEAKLKAKKADLLKKKKLEKEKLAKIEKEKKRKKDELKKASLKKKNKSTKKVVKREGKNLPQIAKSKLGKRYVWGAIGPSYFDCSGFTSYVYKKTGINIPRTSRQQSKYGKLVDRKHLKPGDLIFFDTSRAAKGIINHVGMYIGNNEFIHASSAKKRVVITSLSTKFYSKRFKWARRVIN